MKALLGNCLLRELEISGGRYPRSGFIKIPLPSIHRYVQVKIGENTLFIQVEHEGAIHIDTEWPRPFNTGFDC